MENSLRRRRLPWEGVQVERGDAGRRVAVIFVGNDMLDVNRGEVDLLRICFDMGVRNGVSSHHLRQSKYVMGRFETRAMGKDLKEMSRRHAFETSVHLTTQGRRSLTRISTNTSCWNRIIFTTAGEPLDAEYIASQVCHIGLQIADDNPLLLTWSSQPSSSPTSTSS